MARRVAAEKIPLTGRYVSVYRNTMMMQVLKGQRIESFGKATATMSWWWRVLENEVTGGLP
jgi:hypothetical protein